LLTAAQDPYIDTLAPSAFLVSASTTWINCFWFASLTLSLALVVVCIVCKQWLYEYERYENLSTSETFLVRELRYKGLLGWRVPTIISFLPILLQTSLTLFLAGLLVLLWTLQPIVASLTTLLISSIIIFQTATTVLPSIQYLFPVFATQCPYKSTQSWSLFLISVPWLFKAHKLTSWVAVDQWEVQHIYADRVSSIWRVYESFPPTISSIRNIYHALSSTSFDDGFIAPDFVNLFKAHLGYPPPPSLEKPSSHRSMRLQRLRTYLRRHLPRTLNVFWGFHGQQHRDHPPTPTPQENEQALQFFLSQHVGPTQDPQIFNRHVEHCDRLLSNTSSPSQILHTLQDLHSSIHLSTSAIQWSNSQSPLTPY
jgi:hypothetical protein